MVNVFINFLKISLKIFPNTKEIIFLFISLELKIEFHLSLGWFWFSESIYQWNIAE